jgi:two-component system sensor histidine kinase UhpB
VTFDKDMVVAEMSDDGMGPKPETREGLGMRGMRERAALVGGTFEVLPNGVRGLRVRVALPPVKSRG